jgi:dihydrofolate reductase
MRPVILSVMTSLDGMSAAPGSGFQTIDWCRADDEWLDYSVELLDAADVLLFGWTTYEGMEQYWPTADGPVAERMNRLDKVAFSRSPRVTSWQHARVSADPVGEVTRLKEADGDNLLILASAGLSTTLTANSLIDEYRLAINPVVLGGGTSMFPAGTPRIELDLADTRVFDSGIVELRCLPRS